MLSFSGDSRDGVEVTLIVDFFPLSLIHFHACARGIISGGDFMEVTYVGNDTSILRNVFKGSEKRYVILARNKAGREGVLRLSGDGLDDSGMTISIQLPNSYLPESFSLRLRPFCPSLPPCQRRGVARKRRVANIRTTNENINAKSGLISCLWCTSLTLSLLRLRGPLSI